jgi:hypothetical protein
MKFGLVNLVKYGILKDVASLFCSTVSETKLLLKIESIILEILMKQTLLYIYEQTLNIVAYIDHL